MPRTPILLLALGLLATAVLGAGFPKAGNLMVFGSYNRSLAALAPDGRHLAYTGNNPREIVIVDVDRPNVTCSMFLNKADHVEFLCWVTSARLVFGEKTKQFRNVEQSWEVRAVDVNGRNEIDLNKTIRFPAIEAALAAAQSAPATLRVIGPTPNQPGFLTLLAYMDDMWGETDIAKVDITTGNYTVATDKRFMATGGRRLFDRRGITRILETPAISANDIYFTEAVSKIVGRVGVGGTVRVPSYQETQYYRCYSQSGWGGWRVLDKMFGPAAGMRFHHAAADYYRPRSFPLAFDADPDVLYYASNVGRDTFGIYAFNLVTSKRTDLAVEVPGCDLALPGGDFSEASLVFDRQYRLVGVRQPGQTPSTRWFDTGLAHVQGELDEAFPGRTATILGWADERHRYLVGVTGPGDPGRYFVYQRGRLGRLKEFVRLAPALTADKLDLTEPFAFDTPSGVHLTGCVTLPKQHRGTLPPLLIYCHDFPEGGPVGLAYNGDAEALAKFGLMVVQLNYRGTAGFGLKHRDAVREEGFDRAPVEDIRATIAWLSEHYPFDRKRVALYGQGMGGFVALRAMELYPKEFRCAATLDAPTDLSNWMAQSTLPDAKLLTPDLELERRRMFFDIGTDKLEAMSALSHAEQLVNPVLLVQHEDNLSVRAWQATSMRSALKSLGRDVEYLSVSQRRYYVLMVRVGSFLMDKLYDYRVDIGEVKED